MFYKFLWNDKGDKIKRKVMINDYPEGGLKMIDIASFNKSLKATWIQKYLDPENHSKWKRLFDSDLVRYGGEAILTLCIPTTHICVVIYRTPSGGPGRKILGLGYYYHI